jgi:hypothetical protein
MKKTSSRPFLWAALALLVAAVFIACQSAPARRAADLSPLQGYWEGYGPGGECSVTISGNSLRFYARPDFWFETTFILPAGTDPQQLHATIIKESSPEQANIGTVVVTIFKIEDGTLTLGVLEDFEGPLANPVIGDWDLAMDQYYLKKGTAAIPRSSLVPGTSPGDGPKRPLGVHPAAEFQCKMMPTNPRRK